MTLTIIFSHCVCLIAYKGEESAADIKKETISLAARFHPVGEVLGLPVSELEKVREDIPRNCDQAFSRVIDTWLKLLYDVKKHGRPSWKKFAEAVASTAGGRNPALARKIAAAHPGKNDQHQS